MNDNGIRPFYVNKNSNYGNYNFDLSELTKNFSFYDFIWNAKKEISDNVGEDFSGFFVCTPKQYIVGYTSNFGKGSHHPAFGRVMKDIMGGGVIGDTMEIAHYSTMCNMKYLCARIHFDSVGMDNNGQPKIYGGISFMTTQKISQSTFESFKKFYEDYNKDIKMAMDSSKNDFYISYYNMESKSNIHVDNLEEVYKYLESHIDPSLNDEEEEVIIGIPTKEKTLN